MSNPSRDRQRRSYKGVHRICTACMGTGEVRVRPSGISMPSTRIGSSDVPIYDTCPDCEGTGDAPEPPRS
jgi:DnaJ-class molecular chaperone